VDRRCGGWCRRCPGGPSTPRSRGRSSAWGRRGGSLRSPAAAPPPARRASRVRSAMWWPGTAPGQA
jgi:hypothetical protein